MSRFGACSARIRGERHTHTHTHRANTVTLAAHAHRGLTSERERANLVVQTVGIFHLLYIIIIYNIPASPNTPVIRNALCIHFVVLNAHYRSAYAQMRLFHLMHITLVSPGCSVVSQARPSPGERGSGEVTIIELFWHPPRTGWV